MERKSFTKSGQREQEGLFDDEINSLQQSGRHSEKSNSQPKKKSRKKKFKNFIKRICCMGPTRTTDHLQTKQSKPESFWKAVLDNQIDRQFVQNAEKAVPGYFRDAQQKVKLMYKEQSFRSQVKQDQNEFKLALQNLTQQYSSDMNKSDTFDPSYIEDQQEDKIIDIIQNQQENNYTDMVATALSEFEYQIFNQIREQIASKTNAVYQVALEFAQAFIRCYLPFTKIDTKKPMTTKEWRMTQKSMQSKIQSISKEMQRSGLNQMHNTSAMSGHVSIQQRESNFGHGQECGEIPEMVSDEEDDPDEEHYQKKQEDIYNSFYSEMRNLNDNYAAMDTEHSRPSVNPDEHVEEKAELFKTLSVQAIDEMFIMVTIICTTIEMFFQPFYPEMVTQALHEDFWRLTQTYLFKKLCNGEISESLTILMRVDSQLHDKDLRHKMRKCREFHPEDFEIEDELTMRKHIKKKSTHLFDDEEEESQPNMQLLQSAPSKTDEISIEVQQDKGSKKLMINIQSMDDASEAQTEDEANMIKPYAKTIAHFKLILTKKMAPVDKLFSLQEGWNILFDEISDYQRSHGSKKIEGIGQEQRDYILRYILMKSEVQDLYAQRMLIEEFTGKYIQEGGNELSKLYIEFTSAVDWLANLNINMLTNDVNGRQYLKEFNLTTLNDRMYQYQDDDCVSNLSGATYNMFGGFGQSVGGGSRAGSIFLQHTSINHDALSKVINKRQTNKKRQMAHQSYSAMLDINNPSGDLTGNIRSESYNFDSGFGALKPKDRHLTHIAARQSHALTSSQRPLFQKVDLEEEELFPAVMQSQTPTNPSSEVWLNKSKTTLQQSNHGIQKIMESRTTIQEDDYSEDSQSIGNYPDSETDGEERETETEIARGSIGDQDQQEEGTRGNNVFGAFKMTAKKDEHGRRETAKFN